MRKKRTETQGTAATRQDKAKTLTHQHGHRRKRKRRRPERVKQIEKQRGNREGNREGNRGGKQKETEGEEMRSLEPRRTRELCTQ